MTAGRKGSWSGGGASDGELLVDTADRLRWRAPELALEFARQAATQADAAQDRALSLRARALMVAALVRLGKHAEAVQPAVLAVREAESVGLREFAAPIRVDLAASTRTVGLAGSALVLVRPLLEGGDSRPAVRAGALAEIVGGLAQVGRRTVVDEVLSEADRLYSADESLTEDVRRVLRALLCARVASFRRRWGNATGAVASATEGMMLLDALSDPREESGQARAELGLEMVTALLDAGEKGAALGQAEQTLDQPVRAPTAAAIGRLMFVLATRVYIPDGRVPEAHASFAEVVRIARRHGLDALLADVLTSLAHEQESAGELTEALESLRSARAAEHRRLRADTMARLIVLEELGAGTRLPDDTEALLRRVVRSPARSTAEPPEELAPGMAVGGPHWPEQGSDGSSDRDAETGLLNRQGLRRRLAAARRQSRPTALTLVRFEPSSEPEPELPLRNNDPDSTDRFSASLIDSLDKAGRRAAPEADSDVISSLAGHVRDMAPEQAELVRPDEGELAVLMPDTTRDEAEQFATSLRENMSTSDWDRRDPAWGVHVSTGVAQYQEGTSEDALLSAAREALTSSDYDIGDDVQRPAWQSVEPVYDMPADVPFGEVEPGADGYTYIEEYAQGPVDEPERDAEMDAYLAGFSLPDYGQWAPTTEPEPPTESPAPKHGAAPTTDEGRSVLDRLGITQGSGGGGGRRRAPDSFIQDEPDPFPSSDYDPPSPTPRRAATSTDQPTPANPTDKADTNLTPRRSTPTTEPDSDRPTTRRSRQAGADSAGFSTATPSHSGIPGLDRLTGDGPDSAGFDAGRSDLGGFGSGGSRSGDGLGSAGFNAERSDSGGFGSGGSRSADGFERSGADGLVGGSGSAGFDDAERSDLGGFGTGRSRSAGGLSRSGADGLGGGRPGSAGFDAERSDSGGFGSGGSRSADGFEPSGSAGFDAGRSDLGGFGSGGSRSGDGLGRSGVGGLAGDGSGSAGFGVGGSDLGGFGSSGSRSAGGLGPSGVDGLAGGGSGSAGFDGERSDLGGFGSGRSRSADGDGPGGAGRFGSGGSGSVGGDDARWPQVDAESVESGGRGPDRFGSADADGLGFLGSGGSDSAGFGADGLSGPGSRRSRESDEDSAVFGAEGLGWGQAQAADGEPGSSGSALFGSGGPGSAGADASGGSGLAGGSGLGRFGSGRSRPVNEESVESGGRGSDQLSSTAADDGGRAGFPDLEADESSSAGFGPGLLGRRGPGRSRAADGDSAESGGLGAGGRSRAADGEPAESGGSARSGFPDFAADESDSGDGGSAGFGPGLGRRGSGRSRAAGEELAESGSSGGFGFGRSRVVGSESDGGGSGRARAADGESAGGADEPDAYRSLRSRRVDEPGAEEADLFGAAGTRRGRPERLNSAPSTAAGRFDRFGPQAGGTEFNPEYDTYFSDELASKSTTTSSTATGDEILAATAAARASVPRPPEPKPVPDSPEVPVPPDPPEVPIPPDPDVEPAPSRRRADEPASDEDRSAWRRQLASRTGESTDRSAWRRQLRGRGGDGRIDSGSDSESGLPPEPSDPVDPLGSNESPEGADKPSRLRRREKTDVGLADLLAEALAAYQSSHSDTDSEDVLPAYDDPSGPLGPDSGRHRFPNRSGTPTD